jgi:hypothetical protein
MHRMIGIIALPCLLAACGSDERDAVPLPAAVTPGIMIVAPPDGAVVPAGEAVVLEYRVRMSPAGGHLHIIAGEDTHVVVGESGSRAVGPFEPGVHAIVIQEVTADHAPTGIEARLTLNVD